MILPLRDSIPCIHRPYMTWAILAVTSAVYLFQAMLPPREFMEVVVEFGLIPAAVAGLDGLGGFVTYTFLHSGWWHAISNMWILWIFADNVEDVMGPWRFLIFYVLCGVIAGIAHVVANAGTPIPVVGASGAISGVLGAYFLLYPHARVTTFVFFFILRLPAALYLGGWFALQLFSAFREGGSGIAWWAHLGGFVAGLVLLPLFRVNRAIPATIPEPEAPPPPDDPKDPWARYRSK
ncbi:Rhomboid family protein [uncultured delta proteobacterium]|uniref:Rhomboid family protein n=1 Tax=uncultured delta proteobacterium TaxID=34034 RepID=A0A212IX63_9DELT|nr:Rhomboid family protein [uncultured delta proteobacterium]